MDKVPETPEKAEPRDEVVDPRLIPGGAEPRTPTQQGMAGLDHDAVPGGRDEGGQADERNGGKDDVITGK